MSVHLSALLPVHRGVAPDHLDAALVSLDRQSVRIDEVVVVEDGPLDPAHELVLDRYERSRPAVVRIRMAANRGAGVANQAGLVAARGTWIVKVDADDLSLPRRVEAQLVALRETGADVCGAAMWEFEDHLATPVRLRSTPLTHDQIARRMRVNNPINHPTAVYRRELALRVGGYPALRYMQDYDLFARMLAGGARMVNLPEPLVLFRAGSGMIGRRSAPGFWQREVDLQRRLRRYGVVGPSRSACNLVVRGAFRLLPPHLLSWTYARVLTTPVVAPHPAASQEGQVRS